MLKASKVFRWTQASEIVRERLRPGASIGIDVDEAARIDAGRSASDPTPRGGPVPGDPGRADETAPGGGPGGVRGGAVKGGQNHPIETGGGGGGGRTGL